MFLYIILQIVFVFFIRRPSWKPTLLKRVASIACKYQFLNKGYIHTYIHTYSADTTTKDMLDKIIHPY